MNKQYFQAMFSANYGYVYKWVGEIPADSDLTAYVTEKFLLNVDTECSVVVVEQPQYIILYSDYNTIVESDLFALIADLKPDPLPEVVQPSVDNAEPEVV